ncbi:MAG: 2-hydroxyacid dehydrogenase [Anaeromyxobacteraceae bacterium]
MEEVHILAMGEMMPAVERQLEERFVVHRSAARPLAAIAAEHGGQIRGIATRGRERTDAALIAALPRLEIVSNFGVGYDSIDLAAAKERGVIVTNTPDVLDDEVADFTVGLLLATIRRLPQADRYLRAGRWREEGPFPLSATLRDRTVGMLGMGRIGRRIAKRIAAFDVPVAYHARHPQGDVPYRYHADLLSLARDVDTLVAIVPGGAATRALVNAEVLAALGPRGVLVNVARGSVVDEAALIDALRSGTIHAAGLDVFADEPRVPQALVDLENAVLVPHAGSATHHTRAIMGRLVVENLFSWFDGRGPVTPVPETPWPRRAPAAG